MLAVSAGAASQTALALVMPPSDSVLDAGATGCVGQFTARPFASVMERWRACVQAPPVTPILTGWPSLEITAARMSRGQPCDTTASVWALTSSASSGAGVSCARRNAAVHRRMKLSAARFMDYLLGAGTLSLTRIWPAQLPLPEAASP